MTSTSPEHSSLKAALRYPCWVHVHVSYDSHSRNIPIVTVNIFYSLIVLYVDDVDHECDNDADDADECNYFISMGYCSLAVTHRYLLLENENWKSII